MKVALVHDYLNEFGGAERVLLALCEIWPKAPIYTAFYKKGSPAYERFKNRKIITSWAQKVPFFATKLHSPLRFLAPWVWGSFDFTSYDVVITSASWYVTKGVVGRADPSTHSVRSGSQRPVEVCYCHTPPRYLYGYQTAVEWQKFWPVKLYALVVNHFMRVYDFEAAQRVDYFIANSQEVAARIKKFYRRDSKVIYPPAFAEVFDSESLGLEGASAGKPVDIKKFTVNSLPRFAKATPGEQSTVKEKSVNHQQSTDYFLVVSRLVASKNVDLAVRVCKDKNLPLKVVGTGREMENLRNMASTQNVQFLGEVSDEGLIELYKNCRAVIFPASEEDFGLVPVEAAAAGKPVIALAQGGVLETVIDPSSVPSSGQVTGVYFNEANAGSLEAAMKKFAEMEKKGLFDERFIRDHARKFSKERFKGEILRFVESKVKNAKFQGRK